MKENQGEATSLDQDLAESVVVKDALSNLKLMISFSTSTSNNTSNPLPSASSLSSSPSTSNKSDERDTFIELAKVYLSRKIGKSLGSQLKDFEGELNDEFKPRLRAVKADWMARDVPEGVTVSNNEEEDGIMVDENETLKTEMETETKYRQLAVTGDGETITDGAEDKSPLLHPTIISDATATEEMSHRVDHFAKQHIEQRLTEARHAVLPRVIQVEVLEFEVWIGNMFLQCREQAGVDEAEAIRQLEQELRDALEYMGYDPEINVLNRRTRQLELNDSSPDSQLLTT